MASWPASPPDERTFSAPTAVAKAQLVAAFRILAVDDNLASLQALVAVLARTGHHVTRAGGA